MLIVILTLGISLMDNLQSKRILEIQKTALDSKINGLIERIESIMICYGMSFNEVFCMISNARELRNDQARI